MQRSLRAHLFIPRKCNICVYIIFMYNISTAACVVCIHYDDMGVVLRGGYVCVYGKGEKKHERRKNHPPDQTRRTFYDY